MTLPRGYVLLTVRMVPHLLTDSASPWWPARKLVEPTL
jgi:hypothetical protein